MSDEYEHQSYWTTLNKRLNEEQESICLETDKDGKCLMSARGMMIDLRIVNPPFCETVKNENRQT